MRKRPPMRSNEYHLHATRTVKSRGVGREREKRKRRIGKGVKSALPRYCAYLPVLTWVIYYIAGS